MGRAKNPAAVVDAEGRVHGTRDLRVMDASTSPQAISVPVDPTTLMMAERIARLM